MQVKKMVAANDGDLLRRNSTVILTNPPRLQQAQSGRDSVSKSGSVATAGLLAKDYLTESALFTMVYGYLQMVIQVLHGRKNDSHYETRICRPSFSWGGCHYC
jgi:hypothetical protein